MGKTLWGFIAFCCCLALFTSMEVQASDTSTAEDACRYGAQSNYVDQCMSYARGRYVDGYAAAACRYGAQSNYVHLCIKNAADAYFNPGAAQACRYASQSNYVHTCIEAARNRWYTASEAQTCRNTQSNRVHSCLASSGEPYLGPAPVEIDPTEACARMDGSSRTECIALVSQAGGSQYFDKLAVGVCNRSFSSSEIMACLSQVAGRTYSAAEISLCAGSSSHTEAGNCLAAAGQPIDDGTDPIDGGGNYCQLDSRNVNRLVALIDLIREDLDMQRLRPAKRKLGRLENKLYECLDGNF